MKCEVCVTTGSSGGSVSVSKCPTMNKAFIPFASLWTSERARALFWLKVQKTNSCWIWVGDKHRLGYGILTTGGRSVKAHRASFFLRNGFIQTDMKVLHRCDIRACVNPDHLYLGTQAENVADMVSKGRHRAPTWMTGQLNPMSRTNRERRKREQF